MNRISKFISQHFILLSIAFSLFVLILAPFLGSSCISVEKLSSDSIVQKIFWQIRVPRVLLAWLAGAGLALSGSIFQAIFRNPLATPFTLGIASGSSLGVAIFLKFGFALTLLGNCRKCGRRFCRGHHYYCLGIYVSRIYTPGKIQLRYFFAVSLLISSSLVLSFSFNTLEISAKYLQ